MGNLYLAEGYYIRRITPDGTITTIAGTGVAGDSGDNGLAISATLNYADSLVFDSSGNLFVSDVNNSVVRQISPDGTITTAAGTYSHGFLGDGGSAAKAVLFAEVGSFADSTRTSPVIVPAFKAKGIGTAIVNVAVPGANELFVQIA